MIAAIVFVTRLFAARLIMISWHVSRCISGSTSHARSAKNLEYSNLEYQRIIYKSIWSDKSKDFDFLWVDPSRPCIHKHENTRLKFPISRAFIRLQIPLHQVLLISLRSLVARSSVKRNWNTRGSMKHFRVRYSSNVFLFFFRLSWRIASSNTRESRLDTTSN